MNKTMLISTIAACVFVTSCQQSPPVSAEVTTDATFSYLAKRRSMNVLTAGGQNLGRVGSVYALQMPKTERDMDRQINSGKPIQITPYQKNLFAVSTEVQEETQYLVKDNLATHIGGELTGQIQAQGGSVSGFIDQLKNANIKFKVTRHSAYEREVQEAIKSSGQKYSVDNIPHNAGGLIAPVEYLTVSDFSCDSVDKSTTEGKLAAKYLEQLQLSIENKNERSTTSSVGITDSRIIAIRSSSLVFRQ